MQRLTRIQANLHDTWVNRMEELQQSVVRETSVCWHHGTPIKSPIETGQTSQHYGIKGCIEDVNWASIILRDGCHSDRQCKFFQYEWE